LKELIRVLENKLLVEAGAHELLSFKMIARGTGRPLLEHSRTGMWWWVQRCFWCSPACACVRFWNVL